MVGTCILTEDRNFITLPKENYAIALDSCYLFTKKKLNMNLNMMFLKCLWSLHTLKIRELYRGIDGYLAISVWQFDSKSFCNIIYLGTIDTNNFRHT